MPEAMVDRTSTRTNEKNTQAAKHFSRLEDPERPLEKELLHLDEVSAFHCGVWVENRCVLAMGGEGYDYWPGHVWVFDDNTAICQPRGTFGFTLHIVGRGCGPGFVNDLELEGGMLLRCPPQDQEHD